MFLPPAGHATVCASQRIAALSYTPGEGARAIWLGAPAQLAMRHSLRKTPSHLHIAYKYGEASDGVLGRNFVLDADGRLLTLAIDLTPNFHIRNKHAPAYLDAMNFTRNHHKLRHVQCSDNLVRARLIKAWEQVQNPTLRLSLELGERGHFVYEVKPHSLFMGGIQFDVVRVLGEQEASDVRLASAIASDLQFEKDPA